MPLACLVRAMSDRGKDIFRTFMDVYRVLFPRFSNLSK